MAFRSALSSIGVLDREHTEDDSFEPPLIRKRSNNNALARIDFIDRQRPIPATNTVEIRVGGNGTNFFTRGTKRFTASFFSMEYITPNLNDRNNRLVYYTKIGAGPILGPFVCVLGEEFFATIQELGDHITSNAPVSMDSFFATNGNVKFVVQEKTPYQGTIGIFSGPAGATFVIDQNCSFIQRGFSLMNFPVESVNDPTAFSDINAPKSFGPAYLKYTRYIDLNSNDLTNYQKILNVNSGSGKSNTLARSYVSREVATHCSSVNTTVTTDTADPPNIISISTTKAVSLNAGIIQFQNEDVWHNWKPDQMLASIDFQLVDEYGDVFYTPLKNPRCISNNDINIGIVSEI